MKYKRYTITLTGVRPLLLHGLNDRFSKRVKEWQKMPSNKSKCVPGDDRTPAWTWIGYLYHAGDRVILPSDNLMTMFRDAGKKCPTGKGKATFKSATQSDILVDEIGWAIYGEKGEIDYRRIRAMIDEEDFELHELLAEELGFELFVKHAKVNNSKHARVRPRFDTWSCIGTITVMGDAIDKSVLETLLNVGGSRIGIGDWRPSSPASGNFGMFNYLVEEVK